VRAARPYGLLPILPLLPPPLLRLPPPPLHQLTKVNILAAGGAGCVAMVTNSRE